MEHEIEIHTTQTIHSSFGPLVDSFWKLSWILFRKNLDHMELYIDERGLWTRLNLKRIAGA